MDRKKIFGLFIPRSGFYLWFILVLLIIVAFWHWQIAAVGFVLLIILTGLNIRSEYKRKHEITRYIEDLSINIDSANKNTLLNFPTPLVMTDLDGTIIWYNSSFRKMYDGEDLLEQTISNFVEDLHPGTLIHENPNKENMSISKQVTINNVHYKVLCNFTKVEKKGDSPNFILVLYFIDITDLVEIKKKYYEEKLIPALIVIDNYDDLMQSMEDTSRPQAMAEIERKINQWIGFTDGIVKKFDRDKYLLLFESKYLKEFEDSRFEILDSIKEINVGNKLPITLSMGFGTNCKSIAESFQAAANALDLALGRGGDHVAIKRGDSYSFFGGKTRELEKRTKVKARVIAYALRELIDQAHSIYIMGHDNGDVDSMGAALGLYRVMRSRGRTAHIVLNSSNATIDGLIMKMQKDPDYDGVLIGRAEALERVSRKTLLVVVDTHRPSFTEVPELIGKTDQIVVIDHHRRGAEYIQDAALVYQETYASSTSELITEILQYIDDKLKLKPLEVEALYAGIVVDTKNFTLKTGVRTFEAASYLRRQGADTTAVKQFFQNDLETYTNVSSVVKDAEMITNDIAVSVCRLQLRNAQLIAAKAADELLNLSGIMAAFVLCYSGNEVCISGRSLGDINVQIILEKLGGGGHLTVAGAQMPGISIDEARERLKNAIMEHTLEIVKAE
ncbi:MAG: PAS domain-containing protein [Clostridiales bacterium]|nr:PAS domain-containing protein [Clostridiales bacterium]